MGYQHQTVNHSRNFTDLISGANTNRIESIWRAANRSYDSSGRRKEFYAGYLSKYMFLKDVKGRKAVPFIEFMEAAGKSFNPYKEDVINIAQLFEVNENLEIESEEI